MSKGFLNILIGIIVAVVIAGVGGYVFVSKRSPAPEPQPEVVQLVTEIEVDETAGWKTLKNIYGFQFQYPNNYGVGSNCYGVINPEECEDISITDPQPVHGEGILCGVSINRLNVSRVNSDYPLQQFVENEYALNKENGFAASEIISGKYGGLVGYEFNTDGGYKSATGYRSLCAEHRFMFVSDGRVFWRIFYPINHPVLEEVLSTFKFIEVDETAGWKTYRNEEWEFEFKYPPEKFSGFEQVGLAKKDLALEKGKESSGAYVRFELKAKEGGSNFVVLYIGATPRINIFGATRTDADYKHDGFYYFPSHFEGDPEIKLYDLIVSTFKFIEVDETAGWKTYRNEKYGFEIKYPNEFNYQTSDYLGGIRTLFYDANDIDKKEIFVVINPVPEIGGDTFDTVKIERTETQDGSGYFINRYFGNIDANDHIEIDWIYDGDNYFTGSGRFHFWPEDENDPKIKLYDLIVSTFKFSEDIIAGKRPSIKLIYPNGGEVINLGDTTSLKWEISSSDEDIDNWIVFVSMNSKLRQRAIIPVRIRLFENMNGAEINLKDMFLLDPNLSPEVKLTSNEPFDLKVCLIKRANSKDFTMCDNTDSFITFNTDYKSPFKIIEPNGGEVWKVGSTQTIRWEGPKDVEKVEIRLLLYPCQEELPCSLNRSQDIIANYGGTENDGSFNWEVKPSFPPYVMVGPYSIKISPWGDTSYNNYDYGISDSYFIIEE